MDNFLGIDFGKKKIGIAIALEGVLATGLSIVPNDKIFIQYLTKLIKENNIKKIVIGTPVSMNGGTSLSTESALQFASIIRKQFPDVKVFTYDERLTSKEARRNLPSRKPDDAEAARIILQGFLDKQKNAQEKNIPKSL